MTDEQRAAALLLAEGPRTSGELWRRAVISLLRELAAAPQQQAEPVQEPVAWVIERGGIRELTFIPPRGNWDNVPGFKIESLYAAPQQRKPLTDEQIIDIGNEEHRAMPAGSDEQDELLAIARAIEKAHGITGEQK